MKKLVYALIALLFVGSACFAQQQKSNSSLATSKIAKKTFMQTNNASNNALVPTNEATKDLSIDKSKMRKEIATPQTGSAKSFASESFEAVGYPAGWTFSSPDGGTGWSKDTVGTKPNGWNGGSITTPTGGGTYIAYASYDTGGSSSNDQWLISPQIPVAAGEVLTFYVNNFVSSFADNLDVKISTTNALPASFTTNLQTISTWSGEWTKITISLSAYAGQNVYIAFREYIADNYNDGGAIGIDLVSVQAAPTATDIEVKASSINTMTPLNHATMAFGANIANTGAALTAATNLNITCTPGTYTSTVAIPVPLAMSANEVVNSNDYFTATTKGNYTVTYAAPVTGDPTPANNTASATFAVTDSTWATDDNTPVSSIGNNAAITFGNIYAVLANDSISSISVGFGAVAADLAFTLSLYTVDQNTGVATVAYTSPSFTRTVAMANTVATFDIPNQAVTPGLYLCAINQLTTTNIAVATDASTAANIYILETGNVVGVATTYGNAFIRMNSKVATASAVATLSNLTSGGITVTGFAANTYTYNVELPYGTTVVPTVIGITTDANATVVVTPATSLPGATTVVVTAQDGTTQQTYTINYTVAPASAIATLSNLTSGGATVAGFAATTYTYNVELPFGTTVVPTVTGIATEPNATVVVTPATSLPGATTVVVTAQDGTTQQTYTINYTIASTVSADATLSDLTTGGTTVAGFDAATYTYNVVLPYGTTVVPTVTAATTNAAATNVITLATSLPGATTVVVTAQDGTTQLTYTINYTIGAAATDASLSDLKVSGTTVTGFAPTTYSYNVVLPAGTTAVPPVTAVATDANATITYVHATALPGVDSVKVTAQDGTTKLLYLVNFTVAVQTYTVTYSVVGTNGTLAATVDAAAITSPATVNAGKNVVFTATPAANYSVKEWKLDGTVVAGNTTNTYTLSNLAANSTVTVEFKLNVGVNEATQNVVSIYPNPANDVVNVKMNNTINKIAVVSMNGQVVAESVINNLEGSINISSIANGMYFLRIETANGITMNKIQIVK